jgi:hypothetical protein
MSASNVPSLVHVYRNLNRGCWSIRDARTRLVIEHTQRIVLLDPSFFVSRRGRDRVMKARLRGVHAWIIGRVGDLSLADEAPRRQFTYNPFRSDRFHYLDGTPVEGAWAVLFEDGKAWVLGRGPEHDDANRAG